MSIDLLTPPTARETGVMVACLPGGGIDPAYFHAAQGDEVSLVSALASRGHAVATLALPGTMGLPSAGDGGLVDAAEALEQRIATLSSAVSADTVAVLGHSLGGALALLVHAAATRRNRTVGGVALLGYTPRWRSAPGVAVPPAADAAQVRAVVRNHLHTTAPQLWSTDPVHFPLDEGFAFADDVDPAARTAARRLEIGVPRGLAEDYGIPELVLGAAHALRASVLLVGGDTDASEDLDADAALMPCSDVTTVRLAGSAHWHAVGAQRADLFAAVGGWLDRLAGQADRRVSG